MEFWIAVGLALGAIMVVALLVDRRSRRRGHRLRGGGAMWEKEVREHRRDVRASDAVGHIDRDRSWTRERRRGDRL
jgi:hypothetical protein